MRTARCQTSLTCCPSGEEEEDQGCRSMPYSNPSSLISFEQWATDSDLPPLTAIPSAALTRAATRTSRRSSRRCTPLQRRSGTPRRMPLSGRRPCTSRTRQRRWVGLMSGGRRERPRTEPPPQLTHTLPPSSSLQIRMSQEVALASPSPHALRPCLLLPADPHVSGGVELLCVRGTAEHAQSQQHH